MSRVVVVSGGCGVGKTATLQVMRTALTGLTRESAALETDTQARPRGSAPVSLNGLGVA